MDTKKFPETKQAAFVDTPLYEEFDLEGLEEEQLIKFFYGAGTLDLWCPKCNQPSVFKIASQLSGYGESSKKSFPFSGLIEVAAHCTRGVEDSFQSGCRSPFFAVFFKDYLTIQKIGQYPSAADLDFGSLDEAFRKELDPSHRRELGRAIGLHAHGIGIGSFVYIRRIFESLLEEAHQQAVKREGWDESAWQQSRATERIVLLRDLLPARLVGSASLYGLLSRGIHELSESDCLAAFPLVKGAIELILKDRHEDRRYEAVVKSLSTNKTHP